MKKKATTTTALVCCFLICLAAFADLNGKWTGTFKAPDCSDIDVNYTFKTDGDKITGEVAAQGLNLKLDSGKVNGSDFKFSITNTEGVAMQHTGKYFPEGDSVSMNVDYQGLKMHATLKRAADK
ncbi:MAG: hypothetical protein ACXVAU_08285 [Mucilaginibacter sp.]